MNCNHVSILYDKNLKEQALKFDESTRTGCHLNNWDVKITRQSLINLISRITMNVLKPVWLSIVHNLCLRKMSHLSYGSFYKYVGIYAPY